MTKMPTLPTPRPEPGRRRALQGGAACLLAGLGALPGCGGGADVAPDDTRRAPLGGVDSGGTGSPMMSAYSAAIASTAPVVVGGVAFDVPAGSLHDADGTALDPASLRPGMSARVLAGTIDRTTVPPRAVAVDLRVSDQVRGPLERVDASGAGLTVLGQRVVLTAATRWDPALSSPPAGWPAGLPLQVWGELDVAGRRIVATRVGPAAIDAGTAVVRGVLERLDRQGGRITVGALDAWAPPGTTWPADIGVGSIVRALVRPAADGQAAVLLGLRADALALPDGAECELQGRVTGVESPRRFAVDGIPVDTGTVDVPGLQVGARAEVHGRTVGGVLWASSAQVEPDEPIELEGRIGTADPSSRSFVLRGITVVWSGSTRFEGGTASHLSPRRAVAVVGMWNADRSAVLALRIHVEL